MKTNTNTSLLIWKRIKLETGVICYMQEGNIRLHFTVWNTSKQPTLGRQFPPTFSKQNDPLYRSVVDKIKLCVADISHVRHKWCLLYMEWAPMTSKLLLLQLKHNKSLCNETNNKGYSPFQGRGLCGRSFQPLCSRPTTGPLHHSNKHSLTL